MYVPYITHLRVFIHDQVPVILVGNKIDLRGGEVTNKALEDEIRPIMAEFKVRHPFHFPVFALTREMFRRK